MSFGGAAFARDTERASTAARRSRTGTARQAWPATTGGAMPASIRRSQPRDTEHLTAAAGAGGTPNCFPLGRQAPPKPWRRLIHAGRGASGKAPRPPPPRNAHRPIALTVSADRSAPSHDVGGSLRGAGAEALASARQQTLAAVKRGARRRGLPRGRRTSACPTTTTGHPRRRQSARGRRPRHARTGSSAEQLAATDRRAAERIKKASDGVQSLDLGIGAAALSSTPVDGKGPHERRPCLSRLFVPASLPVSRRTSREGRQRPTRIPERSTTG